MGKIMTISRLPASVAALVLLIIAINTNAAGLSTSGALYSAYGVSGAPIVFDQGTTAIDISLSANGVTDSLAAGASYTGTARASATYEALRTYINIDANNYAYDSFSWLFPTEDGIGIIEAGIVGSVAARIDDTFTVNSSVNGIMNFSFSIDGTITNSQSTENIYVSNETLFSSGASPTPVAGGSGWSYSETFTDNQSAVINLAIPYFANQPTDVWFKLDTFIILNDDSYFSTPSDPTYNFSTLADFFNTATLSEILITDEIGNPIQGATINAGSGTSYQLSALNTVPIPSAVWLFGSGMLALVGMARRKTA